MLISCNNGEKQQQAEAESPAVSANKACYAFEMHNDTILLNLTVENNKATGNLTYNFFEKDDNRGRLTGTMNGDTLFASYEFNSEGVTSVREVAFLKKDNTFTEGFGEMKEEEGKMVFENKKALNFGSNIVLHQIDCGPGSDLE